MKARRIATACALLLVIALALGFVALSVRHARQRPAPIVPEPREGMSATGPELQNAAIPAHLAPGSSELRTQRVQQTLEQGDERCSVPELRDRTELSIVWSRPGVLSAEDVTLLTEEGEVVPCMGFVVTEAGNALGGRDLSDYPVFEGDHKDFAVVTRLTWVDPEAERGGSSMFIVMRCMSATFPDSAARHVHFLFAGLHPGGTLTIGGEPVASLRLRSPQSGPVGS